MMTLDQMLDQAKERQNLTSDRKLAEALGKRGSYITFYRRRGNYPDNDTLLRLAELAEIDPSEALILLNIWRTKSDEAREHYTKLLAKIAAGVVMAAYIAGAAPQQAVADAGYKAESAPINIMRNANGAFSAMGLMRSSRYRR
jgi:transcriptional regulator with XRE-family HTH domain